MNDEFSRDSVAYSVRVASPNISTASVHGYRVLVSSAVELYCWLWPQAHCVSRSYSVVNTFSGLMISWASLSSSIPVSRGQYIGTTIVLGSTKSSQGAPWLMRPSCIDILQLSCRISLFGTLSRESMPQGEPNGTKDTWGTVFIVLATFCISKATSMFVALYDVLYIDQVKSKIYQIITVEGGWQGREATGTNASIISVCVWTAFFQDVVATRSTSSSSLMWMVFEDLLVVCAVLVHGGLDCSKSEWYYKWLISVVMMIMIMKTLGAA